MMLRRKIVSWTAIFALAAALLGYGGAPAEAATSFSDISGHWAQGEVLAAVNYGYINGYADSTFKPDSPITRAEFVRIVNVAKGYIEMTSVPYKDVLITEWYFEDVQKAQKAGYIKGDGDKFRPNDQISREEVAVILNRVSGGNTSYSLANVRDVAKISDWALQGVSAAYSLGYINGDDEQNFNPQNPLKRGEAVKIINRVLGLNPVNVDGSDPNAAVQAPTINAFTVSDITNVDAYLNVTSNRDGTLYWVLLEDESSRTPEATQIMNLRDSANRTPYASANRAIYANTSASTRITSLEPLMSYKVCAVVKDAAGNVSTISTKAFTTLSDGEVGEDWLGGNFKLSNLSDNSVRLTVTSSKAGYLYYVVVADSAAKTPSQSNVRNGRDAGGSTAYKSGNFSVPANSSQYVDIGDLRAGTSYRVFGCVYTGTSSSSDYSIVKVQSFTTTGTDNAWISGMTLMSGDITASTAKFTTNFYVSGGSYMFYWMVVKSGTTAPTNAQIKAGSYGTNAANNANIAARGNTSGDSIPSGKSISYTPGSLAAETNYVVYGVVYNGSTASNIVYTTFKTLASVQYATNLSGLKLEYYKSDGGLAAVSGYTFAGGTYSYSVTVPAGTSKIRVTATPAASTSVKFDGSTINSTPTDILLKSVGTTSAEIEVLQASKTERKYTLNVTVAEPARASLTDLTVNEGILDPLFQTGRLDGYKLDRRLPSSTNDIYLNFTVPDSATSVTVTPYVFDRSATVADPQTKTGSGSMTVKIATADDTTTDPAVTVKTVIDLLVKKSGVQDSTYTLTVERDR
ncbi:MAG: S-layer homology domain-containing protein [Clostridiales Family XIII bacterium]|jgi:hypothetical protein|nr:S-layer homology domain-containing protein [Clostridiales Family XIII bacterium]